MTIDLIADIIAVLDTDAAALVTEATSLQAQIAALQAQLDNNAQEQAEIALFRQLAADIQSGAAFSSVSVPGAPTPTGTPTPVTSGITGV